jgi:phospholipase C
MSLKYSRSNATLTLIRQALAMLMVFQLFVGTSVSALAEDNGRNKPAPTSATVTPIQHVIVIIGENRSFDHLFATYKPKHGAQIANLLSKGIIDDNGRPGPNFALASQVSAVNTVQYSINPNGKQIFNPLPPMMTDGAPTKASDTNPPPFATLAAAELAEHDIFPSFEQFLLTGATGLPSKSIDTRLTNVTDLPAGPYQITPSIKYDDYTGDPVHRFFQMWQQFDCDARNITANNPTGCLHDLFPWVETTIGTGNGQKPQLANFTDLTTGEGSNAMGFFNVHRGDVPYFTQLADQFTMSDNMHQAVMGGTMVNHIMLGYADMVFFSDGKGTPTVPPASFIENPNPQTGTNNFFDNDNGGAGNFTNCADLGQPGVAPITNFLESLPRPIEPNCDAAHFYAVNNVNPGFNTDGTLATGTVVPPSQVRHIGDALTDAGLSFKYYGGHFDLSVAHLPNAYCAICNPFQYASDVMANTATRTAHVQDVADLRNDIANNTLPTFSIAKPDGLVDGHPASSKPDLFEGFVKDIVTRVQASPELWNNTAIFITFDEGGGYYDSGYTQVLDFFGDGTRIPLITVSAFSRGGNISHGYADHVSILKFVERNWKLKPLTARSRDNFPNPITSRNNPYVPLNSPAISDLFDMFNFNQGKDGNGNGGNGGNGGH